MQQNLSLFDVIGLLFGNKGTLKTFNVMNLWNDNILLPYSDVMNLCVWVLISVQIENKINLI